jgi:hypothetical protein
VVCPRSVLLETSLYLAVSPGPFLRQIIHRGERYNPRRDNRRLQRTGISVPLINNSRVMQLSYNRLARALDFC